MLSLANLLPWSIARAEDGDVGNFNTAEGAFALDMVGSGGGQYNTAIGYGALHLDAAGTNNTATGAYALTSNTTGNYNVADGFSALASNNDGSYNTADGYRTLGHNTAGSYNTAAGFGALQNNNTASYNTATGYNALLTNTQGSANTAVGSFALIDNLIGSNNTATGDGALFNNTGGNNNTAYGVDALLSSNGSNNIALGALAGQNLTTGNNNIDIGAPGVTAEANAIRIGKSGTQKKTFIAGIRGVTVAGGVGVIVGSSGQLGTVVSSARFKEAIKPMDKASETLLKLKPVIFRYKEELDPDAIPQFGLIAEEVEKVNPDLVARDEDGKVMTVRYESVNAMLLNEFLKEHRKVEELASAAARQQKEFQATIAQQQKQIEALTFGLQKVTAQLESGKPGRRIVINDQ
jgi:hypothetical protein